MRKSGWDCPAEKPIFFAATPFVCSPSIWIFPGISGSKARWMFWTGSRLRRRSSCAQPVCRPTRSGRYGAGATRWVASGARSRTPRSVFAQTPGRRSYGSRIWQARLSGAIALRRSRCAGAPSTGFASLQRRVTGSTAASTGSIAVPPGGRPWLCERTRGISWRRPLPLSRCWA